MMPSPQFLAPCTLDTFFNDHWGRERLLIARHLPGYFSGVLDMTELDRLVTSTRIPATNLNLARDNDPLPLTDYTHDGAYVDKARVLALHQEGATIILRSLDQWSPGLTRLRVAAEDVFGCEAQVNVYLTPPAEKSTPPHWDTHDLFVLQIAGTKVWRLFRGERTLPLGDERFRIGRDAVLGEAEEVVLEPGDTLYLPRGVIHEPVARSYSVHASLGIHSVRHFDVLEVALRMLATREGHALRESVPRWTLDAAVHVHPDQLADLLSPALLAEARGLVEARMRGRRAVDLEGRLTEIAGCSGTGAATRYARRAGVVLDVSRRAQGVSVSAGASRVDLPARLATAAASIAARPFSVDFTVTDLPGDQSTEDALALCVALREIGALRAVPEGALHAASPEPEPWDHRSRSLR
jgi:ribosomal protein L16 Arg81 hydroxylase